LFKDQVSLRESWLVNVIQWEKGGGGGGGTTNSGRRFGVGFVYNSLCRSQ
jgi:hypothetical protein